MNAPSAAPHRPQGSHEALRQVLSLLLGEAPIPVRRQFAIVLALVVGSALLAALTPLAMKWLVDSVAAAAAPAAPVSPTPAILIACYAAALCGSRLLAELRGLVAGTAEQRLCASLNRRFFGHLLALPLAFHLERRAGAVVHGLYQATAGCQLIVGTILTGLVPLVVETVAVIVIMLRLDQPVLVSIFAAMATAYLAAFAAAGPGYRQRARDLSTATLDLHGDLNDNLVSIEAIKSFGAERAAQARFAAATTRVEDRWSSLHLQRAWLGIAITGILAVSVAASLMVSAQAVSVGSLTLGGFVMANVYMLQVVRPLEMVGSALRDLSQSLEFVRPMLKLLAQPVESSVRAGNGAEHASGCQVAPVPTHRGAPEIRFSQVSFSYRDGYAALDSLDLRIPPGRSLAIVGASGSGKSTLARLLLGLHRPQAGSISLDGRTVDTLPLEQLRAMIGVVPQDTVLFNDTIAFNIALGDPDASQTSIEAASRLAQLHDFIISLPGGYETVVGERGLKLSGGERQRVAIARAVLRRPAIYIFDEATSMLDSETEAALLASLGKAVRGCTTVTIAHRMSTVRHAEEIVVLAAGKVVEEGRHDELLARGGEYARLWRTQRQGADVPPTKD